MLNKVLLFLICFTLNSNELAQKIQNWETKNQNKVYVQIKNLKTNKIRFIYKNQIDINKKRNIGSLMKPISALVFLEEEDAFFKSKKTICRGKFKLNEEKLQEKDFENYNIQKENFHSYYKCSIQKGHGEVNLIESISKSCNHFYLEKANQDIHLYLEIFEKKFYSNKNSFREQNNWTELDKLLAVIGESKKLKFSFKELINLYTQIYQSRKAPNFKIVYQALEDVIHFGSLKNLNLKNEKIYLLAGKTGTASSEELKYKNQAWNLIFFQGQNDTFILLVYVENGTSTKEGLEISQLVLNHLND